MLALVLVALPLLSGQRPADANDEGWVIRSFEATFLTRPDGVVLVSEDIRVDFLGLQRHGIFREIPVEYAYDANYRRRISLDAVRVDDGSNPHMFSTARHGANLQLKIGDPDRTVSGPQRYRISYEVRGALNAFDDHDEFFWNVTGNDWPVTIERVLATGSMPSRRVECFTGRRGESRPCAVAQAGSVNQRFEAMNLSPGEGMTIVVDLGKGEVMVGAPDLVEIKSTWEQVRDFAGLKPLPIALAAVLALVSGALVYRQWWTAGRDRWFGDVHYLRGGDKESTKPLFARETVVVEYTPPELPGGRRLRPAEIGLLLDERADTLDVSATIVDLAVRGYLRIVEVPKTWRFGSTDYRLEKLKDADAALLPYESELLTSLFKAGLFKAGASVEMSDLKDRFYDDLKQVKQALDEQGVGANRFFPGKPGNIVIDYVVAGIGVAVLGVVVSAGLGLHAGAAIVGLPVVLGGIALAAMARAMPRRTAAGRELYRRVLGFRLYMTTAETDRQRFAEEANLFTDYLPYAIVMGCTEKWASAFEGLASMPAAADGWYVGSQPFAPILFASHVNSFSSSMSGAIASTPAGSGGSGFSGGFSGGGFGGGGGGSW
jgi:hypothetical protein